MNDSLFDRPFRHSIHLILHRILTRNIKAIVGTKQQRKVQKKKKNPLSSFYLHFQTSPMANADVFLSHLILPNGQVHPKVSFIYETLTKRYGLTVCLDYEEKANPTKGSCLVMKAMKETILKSKVVCQLLTDEYIDAVNAGDELNICRMEFLEGLNKGRNFVIPVALTSSLDVHPWPGDVGKYLNDYVTIYIQGENEKNRGTGWGVGNLLALAMGDSNHHKNFEESNGFEELYIHLLAKLTNRQTLLFADNLKASNKAYAKSSGIGVGAGAGAIHLSMTSPTIGGVDNADDVFITTTTTTTSSVLTSTIFTEAFMTAAQALVTADDARALIPTEGPPITTDKPGMLTTPKKQKSTKATEAKTTGTTPIEGLITTTHFLGDVLTGERDSHGRCHGLARCVYGSGGSGGGGGGGGNSLVYEGEWQAGRCHGLGYKHWLWPVSQGPGGCNSSSNNSNSWGHISSYAGQWRDGLRHGAGVCHYSNHNNNNNNNNTVSAGSNKDKSSDKDKESDNDKESDKVKGSNQKADKESGQKKNNRSENDQDYARYAGYWSNDKFDGKGVLVWIGGDHYTGDFKQGLMHGTGIWYRHTSSSLSSGDTWYEGEFREGMCEGQGVLKKRYEKGSEKGKNQFANNSDVFGLSIPTCSILVYEGAWLQGKRHGYGVEYWPPNMNSVGDSMGGVQQQVRYPKPHIFKHTLSTNLLNPPLTHYTNPPTNLPYHLTLSRYKGHWREDRKVAGISLPRWCSIM